MLPIEPSCKPRYKCWRPSASRQPRQGLQHCLPSLTQMLMLLKAWKKLPVQARPQTQTEVDTSPDIIGDLLGNASEDGGKRSKHGRATIEGLFEEDCGTKRNGDAKLRVSTKKVHKQVQAAICNWRRSMGCSPGTWNSIVGRESSDLLGALIRCVTWPAV
ncbi:TPA: hypothetical protein ACH3X2_002304 [Trebouxia sp. C0005]